MSRNCKLFLVIIETLVLTNGNNIFVSVSQLFTYKFFKYFFSCSELYRAFLYYLDLVVSALLSSLQLNLCTVLIIPVNSGEIKMCITYD